MPDSYDAITMDSPLEKYTDGYAPSEDERRLLKYMSKMFDEAKRARAHKCQGGEGMKSSIMVTTLSHLSYLSINQE